MVFLICAVAAIFAVCAITIYMFIKGTPALKEVGVSDLLFGTIWKPTASNPSFGIVFCNHCHKSILQSFSINKEGVAPGKHHPHYFKIFI